MMLRRILGPVAATLVVAATGVLAAPEAPSAAAPAAAAAAACSGATGVTALVDFNGLGGSQETAGCDGDGGGRPASEVFRDAGYTLSYSQAPGMNGFVCKIQGQPADGDCAQNDSFWSLWWSDGKSGRWVFSSQGVSTLDVPDGGSVAFAWHEGSGDAQPPDVAPAVHEEPSATPSTTGSTGGPAGGSGGGHHQSSPAAPSSAATTSTDSSESPSATPTDTAHPGRHRHHGDATREKRKRRHRDEPTPSATSSSAVPSTAELTAGPPAEPTTDDDGSSFPVWLGLGIAVVVLGAAGAVPLLRRRTR